MANSYIFIQFLYIRITFVLLYLFDFKDDFSKRIRTLTFLKQVEQSLFFSALNDRS